ncbi:MAG: biotin--[acetyl-CoA-carboxylase] ligase [Candidatus Omnitrophota bacterium]
MLTDDKILELFKNNRNSFLSGEDVSSSLGITRQALWKHIEKLRDIGYVVEAVPHLGYKLLEVPDKILVPEIRWNLQTKIMGRELHFYESVGSTNNVAYELANKGAREGVAVIANEQTKGKGRLGRRWISPANHGVYISCVLRPEILPNEVPKIALVAAVGVAKAIRKFCGVKALIKWPNDISISDRKAGGILTELKAEMDAVDFVILGIGININTHVSILPAGATSLKNETKSRTDFSRVEFIRALLESLEREYIKFTETGFGAVRSELKSLSCTLGRHISLTTSNKKRFHGKAINIDKSGALVIRLDNGEEVSFLSGDVALVR